MRKNRLLGLALLLMVVVFLAIVSAYAQIQLLSKSEAYASPEEAMRALIAASYANVQKVEIIHATKALPFVDDLYFVEARVWAGARVDSKMKYADGDNPGCFFMRLVQGWILVPESKCPALIAMCSYLS